MQTAIYKFIFLTKLPESLLQSLLICHKCDEAHRMQSVAYLLSSRSLNYTHFIDWLNHGPLLSRWTAGLQEGAAA